MHQLVRYPVPTGLSIALVILAFRKPDRAALLVGAATLAAIIPLIALKFITLPPVTTASFNYEFPLKGLDFWLSGLLCICASVIMTRLWSDSGSVLAKVLVIAMLALPTSRLLSLHQDIEHQAGSAFGMLRWHLHLAADGYWRGYGDPKRLASDSDRELFARLRQLVRENRIGYSDRVAHVAGSTNLRATPFPAFTGVAQDLYLPQVDSTNIHTFGGRIHDLSRERPQSRWILVEKSLLNSYPVDPNSIIYENDRVILTYRAGITGSAGS